MNKNMLILSCMIAVSSVLVAAQVAPDLSSGYAKIDQIMCNEQTGVVVSAKNNAAQLCDVKNLDHDVDVSALVDFFECKTEIGKSFLKQALLHPFSPQDNTQILTHRIQLIQKLIEDLEFKAQVEALLQKVEQAEPGVAEFFSDTFKMRFAPEPAQVEFFKKDLPRFAQVKEFFNTSTKASVANELLNVVAGVSALSSLAFYSFVTFLSQAEYDLLMQKNPAAVELMKKKGTLLPLGIMNSILVPIQLYMSYKAASQKRDKLHDLHVFIKVARLIEKLTKKHSLHMQFSISNITNEYSKSLIAELANSRYAPKLKKVFFTSKVHVTAYKLYKNEIQLAEIFACIAELDACNAIATKMLAQTKQSPWCFATVAAQDKPMVAATGFWNVLVQDAVSNDLIEDRNVILTGPNAGGKTTAIRSILQNIVLAQTFGVAAAADFVYTPFDYIHSYIHISDDLMEGLSLFASEVKRAQEILACIKAMQPNEKYFFALDELFTGTRSEEGEKCACEYITKLARYENVQFIYATHFEKLKELGEILPGCVNYKVDAPTYSADGALQYPFTLSQGASDVFVAVDIAANAGLFD